MKTEVPLQSSSISSDFATQFLNLDNPSPADTEINSMMNIDVRHEEPSNQTPPLLTIPVTVIPETSSVAASTIPSLIPPFTPIPQHTITESLENVVLAKSSSHAKSTYEVAASLAEELYDGLVKFYKLEKDLFESYGKVYSLKRDREDKDKDKYPSVGSDQGLKRRKTTKESVFKTADIEMSQNQGSDLGYTDDQPNVETALKSDYKIAKAEKPPLTFDELMSTPIDFSAYVINNLKIDNLIHEHLVGPDFNLLKWTCRSRVELEYHFEEFPVNYFINNDLEYLKGGSSSRKYTTSTTKTKAAKYDDIQGIEDMVPSLWSPVKWYDYGYLEEIEVQREDQQLYKFKEGNFPRINLRDIEDMLLLLKESIQIESRKSSTEHPIVNDFVVINIPEEDVEPKQIILNPNDQPIWENAKIVAPTPNSTIVQPNVDDNFVINSTHLKMIRENKFDGQLRADPHDHIREFLRICDMFRYGETQSEAIKLLIFPFSLCDEAKTWFNDLNEESITSWEQMRRAFINRFFLPSLFNRLLLEIRSFSQLHGLDEPTQGILDITAGGIFLYKSPNQAF
ncbi:reverse transcriptase domain-containing protein [Tanacetum coccineum]